MARLLLSLVGLCLTLLVAGAEAASPEKRVALIIGNARYQSTGALANPLNDADDIAASLRRIGFQVVDGRDLDKRGMDLQIARFARLANEADAALFFYAGHGMQHQGQNYLMPVDAKLEDEFSLQFEMTRLDDVLTALNRARGVRILVLDACRNNPLAEKLARSATTRDFAPSRGLAKIERSQGMVIAYATQANQVAADGSGRNSPFTAALVKEIEEPGLEIGTLFRRVALTVNRATEGQQTPELSVSLLGEFYFNRLETDIQAWSRIREGADPATLREFVARFPQSLLVDAARARLDALERLERERAEGERLARTRADQEQSAREHGDRERQLREQIARERAETERLARDDAAKAEAERLARDPAERERQLQRQLAEIEAARRKLAEESAAREKADRERLAREEAARRDAERAKEAAERKEARRPEPSLSDAAAADSPTGLSGPSLVVAIQSGLKEVGCLDGRIDRNWNGSETQRAVRSFARLAAIAPPSEPTSEFLDALRGKGGVRVCPLLCGAREVARGGLCVPKTCRTGERLEGDGDCVDIPRPVRLKPEAPRPEPKPEPRPEPRLVTRPEPRPEPRPRQEPRPEPKARPRVVERAEPPAPRAIPVRPRVERPAAPAAPRTSNRCFTVNGQSFCE